MPFRPFARMCRHGNIRGMLSPITSQKKPGKRWRRLWSARKPCGVRSKMRALGLSLLAAMLVATAACSRPAAAPDRESLEAAATARLQEIPATDPQKYRKLADMKNWRNPYLVV